MAKAKKAAPTATVTRRAMQLHLPDRVDVAITDALSAFAKSLATGPQDAVTVRPDVAPGGSYSLTIHVYPVQP